MTPKVSIIVRGGGGHAGWLDDTVEGVRHVDYAAVECIIVGERVPAATAEEVVGPLATMTQGLARATGEFVGLLEEGDHLPPHSVGVVAAALDACPDAPAAYTDYHLLDGSGAIIGRRTDRAWDLPDRVRQHDVVPGPGALFRRAAADRAGGWDGETYPHLASLDFWLRLSLLGRFVHLSEVLGGRRLRRSRLPDPKDALAEAAEHVGVMESLYRRADVPAELQAVRAEATSAAHLVAGLVAAAAAPTGDRRFVVYDGLWDRDEIWLPDVVQEAPSLGDTVLCLRRDVTDRDREIVRLQAKVAELGADLARGRGRTLAPLQTHLRFGGRRVPRDVPPPVGTNPPPTPVATPAPARPKVTIVVPTYNRQPALLCQALDSVILQDYPELEVIALDDGSENETPAVLAEYAERHPSRFRFVRHENMGQARTLNRGFALASGDFVGYLADDDLLLPGAVSALAAALRDAPDAVAAYPGYRIIELDGSTRLDITPIEWSAADAVRLREPIVSVGAILRRDLARQTEWEPSLRYVSDYDFWLRVGLGRKFVRVPEILGCHRVHAGSITVRGLGDRQPLYETLRVLDRLYAQPDLPEDVLAVRGAGYRAALFVGAQNLTGALNEPSDRYAVRDLYLPTVLPPPLMPGPMASLYYRAPKKVRDALWQAAPGLMARLQGRAR